MVGVGIRFTLSSKISNPALTLVCPLDVYTSPRIRSALLCACCCWKPTVKQDHFRQIFPGINVNIPRVGRK